jgi:hypothetical protein
MMPRYITDFHQVTGKRCVIDTRAGSSCPFVACEMGPDYNDFIDETSSVSLYLRVLFNYFADAAFKLVDQNVCRVREE